MSTKNIVDFEFIKRAKQMYEHHDNRAIHNASQKKYFNSPKGRLAKSIGDFKRRSLKIESMQELSKEDKKMIAEFYSKRPQGYEVDHIIPISKGGRHHISNLQYLLRMENRRKWCK